MSDIRSLYVGVRDGTRLAIDLHGLHGRHAKPPSPVIFVATQYGRRRKRRDRVISMVDEVPALRRLLDHGYVIAILDVRGTGASFGTKNGYDVPMEPPFCDDLADMLEWIGCQPWCNGSIGMYGYSFVAGTQMAAALAGSPYLKCIAPQQTSASSFRGYMNIGGIQNIAFRERVDALMARINIRDPAEPVDGDGEGRLLAQAIAEHRRMRPSTPVLRARRFADSAGSPNGLEANWPRIAQAGVALLHIGGWRDLYPDETLRLYECFRTTNPSQLIMGPWVHGAQERQPVMPGMDLSETLLRFYDRHLKGEGSPEPAIRYFVHGAPEAEAWREAGQWPPEHERHCLYLSSGELSAVVSAPGETRYAIDYESSSIGLATRYTMDEGEGDYRAMERRALLYTSAPLPEMREIIGAPVLTLNIGSSAPDADIFAYLQRVTPDGRSLPVTEGFLRLSNRAEGASVFPTFGLPHHPTRERDQQPMPSGALPVTVRIAMLPASIRLMPGEQLRLTLMCADLQNWDTPVQLGNPWICIHEGVESVLSLPFAVKGKDRV